MRLKRAAVYLVAGLAILLSTACLGAGCVLFDSAWTRIMSKPIGDVVDWDGRATTAVYWW